jgi:ATPase subunit of ABC transporter with duplicated ATPase domains
MTGQILAGQGAVQATVQQISILWLIASTTSLVVQLLTTLITREVTDREGVRLHSNRLVKQASDNNGQREGLVQQIVKASQDASKMLGRRRTTVALENGQHEQIQVQAYAKPVLSNLANGESLSLSTNPVLTVNNLKVHRARQELSFQLYKGYRVGVTGPSGIGKTQVLRSLAGLESVERASLALSPPAESWTEWRKRVCWVSQDRPTVDGTPNDLFQELMSFRCHQSKSTDQLQDPRDIASEWGLSVDAFDRPWNTLSGGEAQRASLAIVLALQPNVLLLDEALSGLDLPTQLVVEATLIRYGISIVMVTHSAQQLNRFCTHNLELQRIEKAIRTVDSAGVQGSK